VYRDKYEILQLLLMGRVHGKRGSDEISWMRHVIDWTGIRTVEELFQLALHQESNVEAVANIEETLYGIHRGLIYQSQQLFQLCCFKQYSSAHHPTTESITF
jgi:hypothetical protein